MATDEKPPGIDERYAMAIAHGSVAIKPRTSMSGSDVLGAMGIADRELSEGRDCFGDPVRPAPLAVALERLLVGGDNRAVHAIVRSMAEMVWREARGQRVKMTHRDATDMAKAVLAWLRHGVCKPCGGHGYQLIPGTRTHGDVQCTHCLGEGKRPLAKEFRAAHRDLALWLRSEVEREAGRAGPRAMMHLAASMDWA